MAVPAGAVVVEDVQEAVGAVAIAAVAVVVIAIAVDAVRAGRSFTAIKYT